MIYNSFNRSAISFVCVNLTQSKLSMMPITPHEICFKRVTARITSEFEGREQDFPCFIFVIRKIKWNAKNSDCKTQMEPVAKSSDIHARFFASCALRLLKWLKAWLIEPKKKLNTINPGRVFELLRGGEHNHKLCFTRWILLANSFWCSGILFSLVSGHNRFVAKLVWQGNKQFGSKTGTQPSGGS